MYTVTLTFHGDLGFFIPRQNRDGPVTMTFHGRRSAKDLIESMGVPHVEVDIVLVNGAAADLSIIVADGDSMELYPRGASPPGDSTAHLIDPPENDPRFICDVHLRKLARRLRLLGFDVLFDETLDDPAIAAMASAGRRILLTRDRRLLMRRIVSRGYIVRNTDPEKQIAEILDRLSIRRLCDPFTRCIECNGAMEWLDLSDPAHSDDEKRIPPGVRTWCDEYYRCAGCGRIYWKGSHYDRLLLRTESILKRDTGHE